MSVDMDAYGRQFLEDYENGDFEVILTKYRKKKMREILQRYSTRRMLEIGCGMEPFFLSYGDFDYMAVVEPADIMFQRAERYRQESEKNIECIYGFVEDKVDELQGKDFDFILLAGLIHEVEDVDRLMNSVRRICPEHGHVLITTNNPHSFHLTLAYESGIIPHLGLLTDKAKSFQRHRTFTMEEMKQLICKHGFSVVEEGACFVKPFAHSQMKALLDNHIITEAVLDGLDKMVKYIPELGAENYCVVRP